jgi:hypothetical protein
MRTVGLPPPKSFMLFCRLTVMILKFQSLQNTILGGPKVHIDVSSVSHLSQLPTFKEICITKSCLRIDCGSRHIRATEGRNLLVSEATLIHMNFAANSKVISRRCDVGSRYNNRVLFSQAKESSCSSLAMQGQLDITIQSIWDLLERE